MLFLKRSVLLGFVWGIISLSSLAAQSHLQRISITERSDGVGYVIRYHLTEMVDSYDLVQPEVNRVQMRLFSPGLSTESIRMPGLNEEITDVNLVQLDGGVGVDFSVGEGTFFRARTYPDQNLRDLLLSLEYTTQAEAENLASQNEPYGWTVDDSEMREGAAVVEVPDEPERETTRQSTRRTVQRKQPRISFGFSGGLGIANKIGGGYTSDARQGLIMGITAHINLPYVLPLPYSLSTGLETGIYYTQKGFQNPSDNFRYKAKTVVLDYIEVPVLVKISYNLTEIVKPHLLGGLYAAFRTAAETVQDDGDRNGLNKVTNSFDLGGIAGLGSDFVLEKTVVSMQLRYGVGFPRMFDKGTSGRERPGYLSLMLGFRF